MGDEKRGIEKIGVQGEDLPPTPSKIAKEIRAREFVEMAELLPEFEPLKLYEKDGCLLAKTNPRRYPVMQLNI